MKKKMKGMQTKYDTGSPERNIHDPVRSIVTTREQTSRRPMIFGQFSLVCMRYRGKRYVAGIPQEGTQPGTPTIATPGSADGRQADAHFNRRYSQKNVAGDKRNDNRGTSLSYLNLTKFLY